MALVLDLLALCDFFFVKLRGATIYDSYVGERVIFLSRLHAGALRLLFYVRWLIVPVAAWLRSGFWFVSLLSSSVCSVNK